MILNKKFSNATLSVFLIPCKHLIEKLKSPVKKVQKLIICIYLGESICTSIEIGLAKRKSKNENTKEKNKFNDSPF